VGFEVLGYPFMLENTAMSDILFTASETTWSWVRFFKHVISVKFYISHKKIKSLIRMKWI
jgi:hypothetical protein